MKFEDYINNKRIEKGFTLRGFADSLNIAPSYMSDIEKGKRNAPTQEILEKMVCVLSLNDEEKNILFDLAAQNKDEIAKDLTKYVNENSVVRQALRKAKKLNLTKNEWIKIIESMEKYK